MGNWGHKLFEDDFALDIRSEYRDHIGDGLSPSQAVAKLVTSYSPDREDEEDYASFWLALAATSWDLGRLTPLTKRRALAVIDGEIGIDAWHDAGPKLLAARRKVYADIRQRLLKPQPAPVHVPHRTRLTVPWREGTLFSYCCLSGRVLYMRVIGMHEDRGGEYMIVNICEWNDALPPSPHVATRLPALDSPRSVPVSTDPAKIEAAKGSMFLYGKGPKCPPMGRVQVLAQGLSFVPYPGTGGTIFGGWKKLDAFLESNFGIT